MRTKYIFFANKTVFAILTVMILTLCTVACHISDSDILTHMKSPFLMELRGEVDEEEVSARVYCDPTEHLTKEIYEKMIITFSAPESLEGITLSCLSNGNVIARLGNIVSEEYPSDTASIFFDVLCPQAAPTRIKKDAEGKTVAEYENSKGKIEYIFDKDGQLSKINGNYDQHFFCFDVQIKNNG